MKQYHHLLRDILENGTEKTDRTGTGTVSLFGTRMEFDLGDGFPLQTTKRVFWRGVKEELLWMLRGETNIRSLQEKKVNIWDEWADSEGELGPVYGAQWRAWDAGHFQVDQIANLVGGLTKNPDSRRFLVSAWNPSNVDDCALAPCHILFQFNTRLMTLEQRWLAVANPNDLKRFYTLTPDNAKRLLDESGAPTRYLDCQLYQRSGDAFLGVPFNIASYSLLTEMIANVTGMKAGKFIHIIGDAHIYNNHMEQVREVLSREPRPLPKLIIKKYAKSIDDFTSSDDFALDGYDPYPAIVAEVAV